MAKYDHGGGCPCGLYAECDAACMDYEKGSTAANAFPKPKTEPKPKVVSLDGRPVAGPEADKNMLDALRVFYNLVTDGQIKSIHMIAIGHNGQFYESVSGVSDMSLIGAVGFAYFRLQMGAIQSSPAKDI